MIELLSHPNAERPHIKKASEAATLGRMPETVKTRQGSRSAGRQQPASERYRPRPPADHALPKQPSSPVRPAPIVENRVRALIPPCQYPLSYLIVVSVRVILI